MTSIQSLVSSSWQLVQSYVSCIYLIYHRGKKKKGIVNIHALNWYYLLRLCILNEIKRNRRNWQQKFKRQVLISNLVTTTITSLFIRIRIRIRIRIYLLARRNLLWDILRLPSSRRAALGLYVILTLWRGRGANQPPYALLHRSSLRYALRHVDCWAEMVDS